AWVTPYIIDPNNSATLFAGYDQIWETTNRGNTWTSASSVLSSTTKLRSLAIASSNSNFLYAADLTNMWRTTNGGTNWSSITLPASSNSITYIAVKDDDPNTLWITFGGYTAGAKVYESTDGGGSWTNISTGLPDLPVMCIVYYKVATDRNVLFVGTDLGVYVKDGINNWVPFNTGLPNVVVTELEILYTGGTNKLRAGTYGRGLWETNIDAALPVELSSFTAKVLRSGGVKLDWRTETEVDNFGFDVERTQLAENDTLWEKISFVEGHGNSNSPKEYTVTDTNAKYGSFAYKLKQIDTDGDFEYSDVIEVDAGTIPNGFVLEQNYPNPFNPITTIKFAVAETQKAELKVFDILGNEVANLFSGIADGGKVYEAVFSAENFSSGIYFYILETKNKVENRKMLLLK
ncbi:MAG: T9SS type A sorting domain-containing protein, partial [Ignavibacteria bacterium]|nr:T9SS type A sorting domain-containing protein [Ignavibacteria bacterium]